MSSPQPLREDGHGLRGQHEAAPRQGPVAALQEGVAVVALDEDGGVGLAEPLADQEGAITLQPHHDGGEKLSLVVPAVAGRLRIILSSLWETTRALIPLRPRATEWWWSFYCSRKSPSPFL